MKQVIFLILLFSVSISAKATENIYIKNGISPSKEVWDSVDYQALFQALNEKKVPHPTIGSSESGEVFSAMISARNMDFFEFYLSDKAGLGLANSSRTALQLGASMLQPMRSILLTYIVDPIKFERELAEQLSYMTTFSGKLLITSNKFEETFEGELTEIQRKGIKQMQGGLVTIMDGLITSISELHYSDKSLITMSESIDNNIKIYSSLYDEEYTNVIIARLNKLKDAQKNPTVKANLTSAIEKLETEN